ncbi:hypothetical protein ACOXXX_19235 [Thalassococcus sp. BH17M4-6]|uniref:hypothetical protein n=1 Tax=Thalassococcus sp. BH17M4-6 TaxID=3413148 RepID=UPI003BCC8CB7
MVLLIATLLALAITPLRAQDDDGQSRLPGLAEQLAQANAESGGPQPEVLFPTLPENFVADDATLNKIQASVQGYYDYRTRQYQHRLDIFRWQHVSSQIIFGIVVLIVLAGLYFSWMQFRAAEQGTKLGVTSLEASDGGFKVTSPVLGVIILVLSLAFFYLYLIYVYPVTDSF